MPLKTKSILFVIIVFVLLPLGAVALWNESFYFDRVPMLAPIAYKGPMPVRNDFRGEGEFGSKRSGNRSHQGIDIFAGIGTPVRAAKGGIAYACFQKRGMGKYVKIYHRGGIVTIYGHLAKISINPVQRIRQGQIIGEVGDTGNAKYRGIQPHLHFEIRIHGVATDPKKYLS